MSSRHVYLSLHRLRLKFNLEPKSLRYKWLTRNAIFEVGDWIKVIAGSSSVSENEITYLTWLETMALRRCWRFRLSTTTPALSRHDTMCSNMYLSICILYSKKRTGRIALNSDPVFIWCFSHLSSFRSGLLQFFYLNFGTDLYFGSSE